MVFHDGMDDLTRTKLKMQATKVEQGSMSDAADYNSPPLIADPIDTTGISNSLPLQKVYRWELDES